jgi:hypothetical protein
VLPLLVGDSNQGRHRSLSTLTLKGITEQRIEPLLASLRAVGIRATRNGQSVVVPFKDARAVANALDLERLSADQSTRRFDDRWWYGFLDVATDLGESDPDHLDGELVERFLGAQATFVRRGVDAGLRADAHGRVLGLAEAAATFLRTGRPAEAVDAAAKVVLAGRRLR